jgi:hypothetical protein
MLMGEEAFKQAAQERRQRKPSGLQRLQHEGLMDTPCGHVCYAYE